MTESKQIAALHQAFIELRERVDKRQDEVFRSVMGRARGEIERLVAQIANDYKYSLADAIDEKRKEVRIQFTKKQRATLIAKLKKEMRQGKRK